MKKAVANAEFVKHLGVLGLEPASSTPEEFRDMIRTELERWTRVIREAGITADSVQ